MPRPKHPQHAGHQHSGHKRAEDQRAGRRGGRAVRRALILLVALSTLLVTSAGPTLAATSHPASISLSGIWNWLTRRNPELDLPGQQSATANGLRHQVPASVTRAHSGTGRPPGHGHGQLPPFKLHGPAGKTTRTGQDPLSDSGFNPATSRPVMAKSTATSTLYRNANGTYTRHVYTEPVNFRGSSGAWQPIRTQFVAGGQGWLHEKANSLTVGLAPTAANPALVSVGLGAGRSVSYGLAGAAAVPPRVSGSTVTYAKVLPQTDLTLTTVASGLKESLVLHGKSAPSSWLFPLHLTGLTARLAADGSVHLLSPAGATVARIPPAFMADSNFARRSGNDATSNAISYQLVTINGVPSIKMTASRSWLDSKKRVYPVTVDPSFIASGTTYVMYPDPMDDSVYNDLLVGTWDNGGQIGNSFLAFSGLGTSLAGEHISAATLELFDMEAATCTPEPFYVAPVTQSWPVTGSKTYPGPSYGSQIGTVTDGPGSACTNTGLITSVGTWMAVPLSTPTFNSWTTGGADNGLAIYAATTGDLSWKRFDSDNSPNPPYLSLTYTPDVAPQINSQYPPDNYQSPTLTPELIASGSDPDGWPSPVKYVFTVYTASGTQVATSGLVSTGNWVVPAGKLSWAQTYYWTVQDYDGFDYSSAVNASYFTTQVPQPILTSSLAQNTGGHGFDQSVGNYTTTATDANVQTAGPSLSVVRDYNSLDPRTSGAFGAGWSSLYDLKATEVENASGAVTSVVITYPDGSEVGFGDNNGTFTPPLGRFATLTALPGNGGFTLTDKNDTTYTFAQAGTPSTVFDISSISDYLGNKETFTYSGGQLATVTSAVSGRALHFTWATPAGAQYPHVASVSTDPATAGQPSTALTWNYNYTGDQLTSVCPPASPTQCTGYSYTTGSHFPTAVLDAGPAAYWRMNEGSGGTAVDSVLANEGVYNGTYSNVSLGQPGPLPGSAATSAAFNGTSSYLQLPASLTSNASYLAGGYLTVSLWFKTSTDNDVIFGSSSNPISGGTTSGSYVPSLYVGSDGKLEGELYGSSSPISSASSVADGNWHYAVVTAAGSTESLYLDGSLVGSQNIQVGVTGQPYVYAGAGFIGGNWPDESHHEQSGNTGYASYFNGDISDVALFSQYLTAPQVSAIYATGHAPVGLLSKITEPSGNVTAQISYNSVTDRVTSVTDADGGTWTVGTPSVSGSSQVYRSAVLGADPAGYWRLGDSGSPAQAAGEVLGGPASYSNVTLGVTGPFADESAASFNGTSSYLQVPSADQPGNGAGTIGLWFKVPKGSTTGGVLYDYESNPLSYPGQPTGDWVPALYVGTDGKLRGEFWNGSAAPITSAGTVNDGNWHYAVLAANGSSGQSLYLDGALVGTSTTGLVSSPASDVYVGAGVTATNWPSHSSSLVSYFTGSIAEVAYYRSQLSAGQVLTQWNAARSSAGLAPTETVPVTDPGGHAMSYSYDPLEGHRLIASTDALGNRTSYGYDTSGFLYTTTQPDGNVITTGHDVRGNLVSQTTCQNQAANQCSTAYYTYYPDDTSTTLAPDPRNDLILTIRDGRSSGPADNRYLTTYAYNAAGNQTSATTPPVTGFPSGRTTTLTYTTASTAATGGGTTPAGLLASTTTPGGATESIGYYSDGDVASVTDPAGELTRYTYDGLGRVLTKTAVSDSYPDGLTTSYTYDGAGRVLTQNDPGVTDHVTGAIHTARTTNAYDVDGNLTSVTVADLTGGDSPRTSTYTYNSHDQMASRTDPDGDTTTFGYDSYGNQVSQTDAAGNTSAYSYDPNADLLTVTAGSLTEQSRAYDPDGRLASITDAMGRETAYTYTDNGLVATVTRSNPATGPSSVIQSNYYDAAGNLTERLTNNGTTTTTYAVDAANRTDSTTLDPTGLDRTTTYTFSPDDFVLNTTVSGSSGVAASTDYTYDPLGRMLSSSVHDGSELLTTTWTRDQRGLPTSMTDPDGNTTTYQYDEAGKLAQVTGPAVSTVVDGGSPVQVHPITSYGYDTFGDQVSTEDPNGNVTTASYDADGREVGLTQPPYQPPDGGPPITATTTRAYNNIGELTSVTDPVGNTTSYAYDQFGDVTTVTQPGGGVSSYTYDADGEELSATNPVGAQTSATYDFLGHELTSTQIVRQPSLAAYTTTSAYNSAGYLASVTSPAGVTTSYGYDAAGDQTSVTNGTGNETTYGYDALGRQVSVTNPDGTSQAVTYDEAGLAVSQASLSASGSVLRQASASYDANGNLTGITDPAGDTTTLSYNALGLPIQEVQPVSATSSITTSFGYDPDGNLTSYTDGNGNTTSYTFSSWNLPESTIVPATAADPGDRTFTTSYNADGEPATRTSPGGVTVTDSYDALGDLTSQAGSGADPPTATRTFGYNAAGEVTSASTPGGTDAFSYDDRGLLLSATGSSGNSSFSYNGDGQLASATTAAGTSGYSYDADGRLSALTDATTGAALSYGYNSDSELTSIGYGSGDASQSFTYNGLHQLTGDTLTAPSGQTEASIGYGYNAQGDETSKTATGFDGSSANTYTYDEANRLTSWNNGVTTVDYGYDADGNRTQDGSQTFSYDARDELLSGGGAAYSYTPRGTLASVTTGSGTTSATFDAFGELSSQGSQQYSYDALGRVISGQGASFSYEGNSNDAASDGTYSYSYAPGGDLVGIASGSSSLLALTDVHKDVVGEFTPAGPALAGSVTYDPLGNVVAAAGQVGNLGYQSGWTSQATSDVDMGSRWYNPATGQFMSRDSASNSAIPAPVTANTFAYGDDNPLTADDPTGTCGLFDFGCDAHQLVSTVQQGASNLLGNASSTLQNGWNTVTSTLSTGAQDLNQAFGNFLSWAPGALNGLAISAVHLYGSVVQHVQDAYNNVTTTISNAYHGAVNTVKNVYHAATTVVTSTFHAVKYAATQATQFVQHHAAAIVSFVASTAVFMGCEAVVGVGSGGLAALPGAVGCSALAGAVGNIVTYAMTTPTSKWSLGGFASTALQGAATGAVSGLLGGLGSEFLGPVLDAVGSRLGPAVIDDAASAADDLADGALDDAASDVGSASQSSATDATAATDTGSGPGSGDAQSTPDSQPAAGSKQPPKLCSVNSFVGSTRILLASGRRVAIDKLKASDRVRAANPYLGVSGNRAILHVIRHSGPHAMVAITLSGGSVIRATAYHLLWNATAGTFSYASALKPGDKLAEPGGRLITITRTRAYRADLTAWNLSISGIHTYYVAAGRTAVLVHNDCPDGEPLALPSGEQGSVTRNALEPHEYQQAQDVVGLKGGTFEGNATRGAPGIDGTLDGDPVSLKSYSGSSPMGVLRHASVAEAQASAAGMTGVDLYINAPNVSGPVLLDFAANGPLGQITSQGVLNSISVFTQDGWIIFP